MKWALVAVRVLDSLEPWLGVESFGLWPAISQVQSQRSSEQLELDDTEMYKCTFDIYVKKSSPLQPSSCQSS